ncbi:hypothetical protein ACWD6Q_34890, partial [Streptomyces nigra]
SCPGNTLIVDHVSIDKRLRGHGVGVFLTGLALEYLSTDTGVIALFPGPIERDPHPTHEEACARLGAGLVPSGLHPLPRRVWVLDPGLTTLETAIDAEQQRLADHAGTSV